MIDLYLVVVGECYCVGFVVIGGVDLCCGLGGGCD